MTSYSAFSAVDDLVSKPVLGSDGAASWQDFQKKSNTKLSRGAAPVVPLKKADKLGTGFQTRAEERAYEERGRSAQGEASIGAGYTHFKKRKNETDVDVNSLSETEPRVRPDGVIYFIPAETFEGWKEDYVFTTKHRGTGYYWDGMDSLRKALHGKAGSTDAPLKNSKKKKKKKKDRAGEQQSSSSLLTNNSTVPDADSRNPYEQVENAIRRRNEAIMARQQQQKNPYSHSIPQHLAGLIGNIVTPSSASLRPNNTDSTAAATEVYNNNLSAATSSLAAAGWATAVHPSTKKTYYYHTVTKETRWEYPLQLTAGWKAAKDVNGKEYYYQASTGKTTWDRPT